MNFNERDYKKSITLSILRKFILSLGGFFLAFFAIFLVFKNILSSFIWYGDEPLYGLLKVIEENIIGIFILLLLVGFFILLAYYWNKTLGYLKMIMSAMENVYNDETYLVKLPPELREIENRINEIKINIQKNKYAAKEAERRKNDLIIYLAHDLKTPLTSVIGYLTLLKDEKEISSKLREKYTDISLEKAQRLEDLINEFFEITRFNLTDIKLEKTKVNLTMMLEQLLFEFKPMLKEKNLEYSLNLEKGIMFSCDPDKMQRVFDNLLKNAVNYSFENSNINITLKKNNDKINIDFVNNGHTIPKEKLDCMFEQFYRLDSSRRTNSGGAGLGLAIAKEITKLHKGTISAESKDDTISFHITLPCS